MDLMSLIIQMLWTDLFMHIKHVHPRTKGNQSNQSVKYLLTPHKQHYL